jgi:hypothetical protein
LRRRITKARRERIGTDGKERERGGMFLKWKKNLDQVHMFKYIENETTEW